MPVAGSKKEANTVGRHDLIEMREQVIYAIVLIMIRGIILRHIAYGNLPPNDWFAYRSRDSFGPCEGLLKFGKVAFVASHQVFLPCC